MEDSTYMELEDKKQELIKIKEQISILLDGINLERVSGSGLDALYQSYFSNEAADVIKNWRENYKQ